MAKRSNVIEINGRRYDASTGRLIKPAKSKSTQKVDGFTKPAKSASKNGAVLAPSEVKKEVRKRAAHAYEVHNKTKKSKTLMRSAITKPKPKTKKKSFRSKILTPATAIARGPADIAKTEHATTVTKDIKKIASSIKKSPKISKFYSEDIQASSKNNQSVKSVSKAKKVSQKEQLIAAQMAKVDTAPRQSHKKIEKKSSIKRVAARVKKSPKTTTIAATFAVALLLFGYVTYLNIPNMALRVASVKAGFDANMPGYSPSGYSFAGPVAYSPGQITIEFDSNTDDRSYDITQRQTNWDSKSLLDNFVKKDVASDSQYSTFYNQGLTVYIYNGSNAAWVSGGIWYTVSGNSLLNSEQLLRIAASL